MADPAKVAAGLTKAQREALPKARLFYVRWRHTRLISRGHRRIWRAKFRLANAMFVWVGPLEIGWRMPWLAEVARTLYPELFPRPSGRHHTERTVK